MEFTIKSQQPIKTSFKQFKHSFNILAISLLLSMIQINTQETAMGLIRTATPRDDNFNGPNSEVDLNAMVNLRDIQQQQQDLGNLQTQERLKEFAGNMMQQRQLTDSITINHELPTPCVSSRDELDRCSAQLIAFGSSKATYPHDMDELNNVYCPRAKKLINCIKESSTCYSRFDRQVIDWVLISIRKMSMKRCRNENEKHRFVRMVNTCFEPMNSMKDKCMRNYIGSLDAIADSDVGLNGLSEDISIQLSCCANKRFKTCMMREAKHHCKSTDSLEKLKRTNSVSSQSIARRHHKKSMKDMMDDMESTIDGMALSGPEFFCRGVNEHFCRNKFDPLYSNKIPRHKSILPSMIMIYSQRT